VAAQVLWGLFPLFVQVLEPAGAVEILVHRIAWSVVFLAGVLALTTGFGWLRDLDRRRVRLLALAAGLITVNWGMFIYGVISDRVVEASLGYFINPLVTVALAVVVLGERLSAAQRVAVAIATVAVVVLAIDYGHPPWIGLTLAFAFGGYGLVKNRAGVEGTPSVAVETAILLLPALAVIGWLEATGRGTFTDHGAGHAALLASAGVATALPLMLFGAAAIRIPLSTLGLIQYITPVLQFLIGVLVDHEPMPAARLAGFALVWIALAVFIADAITSARGGREARRLTLDAPPA
jgi:chloramphenicol-sensitive protein RarD